MTKGLSAYTNGMRTPTRQWHISAPLLATFAERYASMVDRKRFVVFGEPSDELRAILDRYGAMYHRPFGRFPYWG